MQGTTPSKTIDIYPSTTQHRSQNCNFDPMKTSHQGRRFPVGLILMSCVLEPLCVRILRAVSVSVGCAVWETPGAFLASHRKVDHGHCDFYLRTHIFWGTSCHPNNMV